MKNILFLICAVFVFFVGVVSAAHAHFDMAQDQIFVDSFDVIAEFDGYFVDEDDVSNSSRSGIDPLCDTHCHNHMTITGAFGVESPDVVGDFTSSRFNIVSPYFIYGLNRPPKL